jgi:hypothetical protein
LCTAEPDRWPIQPARGFCASVPTARGFRRDPDGTLLAPWARMIRLEQVRAEMIERFERIDRRLAHYDQRLARIEQRGAELAEALDALRLDLAAAPEELERDLDWVGE